MNFVYAFIASLVFSFYDYFGYNVIGTAGKDSLRLAIYRVTQVLVGAGLFYVLWQISPRAALGASAFYLFFLDDFLYYAFCLLGWYGTKASNFKEEILGNQCTWAWGTPMGLAKWGATGVRKSILDGDILCIQAAMGLFVALAITKVI